jgi:8-oxo-dGTP diphosphatase
MKKEIQKAVLRRDDKFLIVYRSPKAKYFPEYWDFAGGGLEEGEEPFSGIEREVLEETGLNVKALKVAGVYEYDLDNAGKNTHRFTVYEIEPLSDFEIRLSHEHLEYAWSTKREILAKKIEPFIIDYFKEHS